MQRSMGFRTIAIVAGLGGLLFGYDTGVISGALLYIRHDFNMSHGLQGLLVAATLGAAAIGSAFAGWLSDRFGRRIILLITAIVFALGAMLCTIAWSLGVLFAGRCIVGIAIGVASMLTPLYLSEMAPRDKRGGIVTLNQIFLTLGLFLSYLIDYGLTFLGHGPDRTFGPVWRYMLGIGAIPGLLLFGGMMLLPESPRWLLGHGQEKEAEAALDRLRPGSDPSDEFDQMRQDIGGESKNRAPWSAVFKSSARRPLLIGMGLAVFQQVTGINTVIYFAPTTFKDSGIASTTSAILATAGVGLVNFLFTVLAARMLDSTGRRKMLLVGQAGMFGALLAIGICFAIGLGGGQIVAWLIIAFIAVYVAFFAIGLGPVFWLMIAEIFPLAIRGRGMSMATVLNWLCNMVVSLTFLDLTHGIGRSGTFFLYAGLTALATAFTWYFVPETKGRSLEEIERELEGDR
ncbi:sugar porter family MFS transporter [Acidisoma sp. 7E03]